MLKDDSVTIRNLEQLEKVLLKSRQQACAIMSGDGSIMDIYTLGTIKRSWSLANAFDLLVRNQHFYVPSALLRLQIDNCLRYHAASLVSDRELFVQNVFNGDRIDKCKDRNNNIMHDKYLVESLSEQYPWVRTLYDEACRYIHLSDKHLLATIASTDPRVGITQFEVSPFDPQVDEDNRIRLIEEFIMVSCLLNTLVEGWVRVRCASNAR